MNPDKAAEAQNVRVALATDGFNPFGMMATPYTCWPVFVIPLNLSPDVMFKPRNVFLMLVIPGHSGNNMGVFMEPPPSIFATPPIPVPVYGPGLVPMSILPVALACATIL
jgi:hypothetical protein